MPDHDEHHARNDAVGLEVWHGGERGQTLYAAIFAALSGRIALIDRGCRLLAANPAFLAAIGREQDESIGQSFMTLCGASTLTTLVYRHLGTCLDQGRSIVTDWLETTDSGVRHEHEVRLLPCRDLQGEITGIVIEMCDVTAMREAERRMLQSAAVYAATSEGVLITDSEGIVVAVNAAFTQITGYAESEILGQKPTLLNAQWHSRGFFINLWRRLLRQGSWQGEIWNRRKNGEIYRQRLTIRRVLDPRGRLINFVGLFAERTASAGTPRLAEHLIHYDALTKLPNRLLLESRLDHAIELGRRKESPLALFIADLDHFSHINASLGYQIGDDLLRAIGLKLREAIRPSDTLARLHADQFALLFEEVDDLDEIVFIANRLKTLMSAPIWIRGHQLHVSLSIGIAVSTELREDRRALMANAESALRQVKRQGRNGFQILSSAPDQVAREHRRLLDRLRAALGTSEFQLHYRPGMDMTKETLDSVAVSIHWEPPELGMISQERLLPLAEESGLILELGDWVLAGACRQLQDWIDRGLSIKRLVVEISEAQLTRGDLARTVAQRLEDYPAAATRLDLEFSERLLVKHREQIAEVFQGLNELGVGICLGEVGIGWTAPALLQRLPIRALKIHSNFIEALPDAHHELAVVEALIAMAQALGLEIRADGVRTKEQQYQLLSIGCLKAQGDLFGEPLRAAQFESRMTPQPSWAAKQTPLGN
ncbi:putative bifunctional diguanylate cyclase/phosphodiesterase [Allochromatium vinosum]|uniref:putative bifunctional diguanylate cyclase/phosphodiesterase n=1 Tax=Allochromatium vinosum TaxID=1049 RepID=UPI001905D7F8|nr:EAL domain-containing protein [Allochromatium vinosum]MBK1654504.1 GGDEF domain-containing protein [Allochromatium vinosum]